MNLQKGTRIGAANLEVRLEVFNLFNHRNYSNPSVAFSQGANISAATVVSGTPNATFGQIDGIVGTMRQIQLGAKLVF